MLFRGIDERRLQCPAALLLLLVVGCQPDTEASRSRAVEHLSPYASAGILTGDQQLLRASDQTTRDYFGAFVDGLGDVDGDGYDDVTVGAPGGDEAATNSGAAYVYLGASTGLDAGTELLLAADDGATGDEFGVVRGLGDVDGDGFGDLGVGAPEHGHYSAGDGAVYLFYGTATGIDGSEEDELNRSYAGADDALGETLDAAGDVDGDGLADVILGAPGVASEQGRAFVYLGSSSGLDHGSELALSASDGVAGDRLAAVAGAGDIDGDGYDDVVVGAAEHAHGSHSGAVYAWYGSTTGVVLASEQELLSSDPKTGEALGSPVSGAGDVDGDGFADVIAGAADHESSDGRIGAAYVFYGSTTGLRSDEDVMLSSADTQVAFGQRLAGLGDLDGDGFGDLLLGDDFYGASTGQGQLYVVFGSASGVDTGITETLTGDGLSEVQSFGAGLGRGLAAAGDVDGDGHLDILGGAPFDETTDSNSGSIIVFSGKPCTDVDDDHICASEDCDDSDASLGVESTWYTDDDADGYGTDAHTGVACTQPSGMVSLGGDCDDSDSAVNPGATEIVGDEVDGDCDGVEVCYVDGDGDGVRSDSETVDSADADCTDAGEATSSQDAGDCDDGDVAIYPGAFEIVGDEVDSDCDLAEICYADLDLDGYAAADGSTVSSSDTDCDDRGERGAEDPGEDCDDGNGDRNPGATEAAGDEVDADCDGVEVCFVDLDGDGYRPDITTTVMSTDEDCADSGEATNAALHGDCDDGDASYHPGAAETDCTDPNDYNCDGSVMYADEDADGWPACTECDDFDAAVNPDAVEAAGDGLDADCDGTEHCFLDADGDGFLAGEGRTTVSVDISCSATGLGHLQSPDGDCDDEDAGVYPGALERPGDSVDQDCDGIEHCHVDLDGDGFRPDDRYELSENLACDGPGEALAAQGSGDCDDDESAIHPEAEELVGDEVDSNCDGAERCYVDGDGDGFRDAGSQVDSTDANCHDAGEAAAWDREGDCDDADPDVHPHADELCNEVDDDCDGIVDGPEALDTELWYGDSDGDGFTIPVESVEDCTPPEGFAAASAEHDCADRDPDAWPGAPEVRDDGIDQDCDGQDLRSPPTGCTVVGGSVGWATVLFGLGAALRRRTGAPTWRSPSSCSGGSRWCSRQP